MKIIVEVDNNKCVHSIWKSMKDAEAATGVKYLSIKLDDSDRVWNPNGCDYLIELSKINKMGVKLSDEEVAAIMEETYATIEREAYWSALLDYVEQHKDDVFDNW